MKQKGCDETMVFRSIHEMDTNRHLRAAMDENDQQEMEDIFVKSSAAVRRWLRCKNLEGRKKVKENQSLFNDLRFDTPCADCGDVPVEFIRIDPGSKQASILVNTSRDWEVLLDCLVRDYVPLCRTCSWDVLYPGRRPDDSEVQTMVRLSDIPTNLEHKAIVVARLKDYMQENKLSATQMSVKAGVTEYSVHEFMRIPEAKMGRERFQRLVNLIGPSLVKGIDVNSLVGKDLYMTKRTKHSVARPKIYYKSAKKSFIDQVRNYMASMSCNLDEFIDLVDVDKTKFNRFFITMWAKLDWADFIKIELAIGRNLLTDAEGPLLVNNFIPYGDVGHMQSGHFIQTPTLVEEPIAKPQPQTPVEEEKVTEVKTKLQEFVKQPDPDTTFSEMMKKIQNDVLNSKEYQDAVKKMWQEKLLKDAQEKIDKFGI